MTEEYRLSVTAGPDSDTPEEPFRYVKSSVPKHLRSVDEEPYKTISEQALLLAREIVLATGKNIRITLDVKIASGVNDG